MAKWSVMKQSPLEPFFERQGLLLLDGGLATELQRQGHDLDHALWSAHLLAASPDVIQAAHLSYLNAGADCLLTSSYQATVQGFMQQGLSCKKAEEMLVLTVTLATQARASFLAGNGDHNRSRPLVAASIGPYGAYLADGSEYDGCYGLSRSQLRDFHQPRWALLVESEADFMACETIPSLIEVEAVVELLKQDQELRAWVSLSCGDPQTLCDGTPLRECAALLAECDQVLAVGANCLRPEWVLPIVRSLKRWIPAQEIVVYPNSGETYQAETRSWCGDPEIADFGQQALTWRDAGARIIGGCCRTGPAHIAALRKVLLS